MQDYAMLFESIVLTAWDKQWRGTDPFKLGDAGTLQLVDNNLSGRNGHNAKFMLSTALIKVAAEHQGTAVYEALLELDQKLWKISSYNEMCQILDKAKVLFENTGMTIV